ncbi:MAG: hypothetical protein J0H49_00270 [Acidobacteria bacterium]|nr:hypothetical protein [Acidobacteriota bacterium]
MDSCTRGAASRTLTSEERAFCQQQGYLFPGQGPSLHPLLIESLKRISVADVARGFVASLAPRMLELRSALGSFGVVRTRCPLALTSHEFVPSGSRNDLGCELCEVCGMYSQDAFCLFSDFSFSRAIWGGDHENLQYATFDLWCYAGTPRVDPTAEDVRLLRNLIARIQAADPADTAPRLAAKMKGIIPSNNAERVQILELLAWCGVLPETGRDHPARTDLSSPAAYWRGSDGLDPARLEEYFGEYL